jgi:hypothetical protein
MATCSGFLRRCRKLIWDCAGSTNMSWTMGVFCGMLNSATFFWISSVVVMALAGRNSWGIWATPTEPLDVAVSPGVPRGMSVLAT